MKDKIIIAIDKPYFEGAIDQIHNTLEYTDIYKLGHIAYSSKNFWAIADYIMGHGKKIFLDLKFWDIPTTILETIQNYSVAFEYMTIRWDALTKDEVAWLHSETTPLAVVSLSSNDNFSEQAAVWDSFIRAGHNGFTHTIMSPYMLSKSITKFKKFVPGIRLSTQPRNNHSFTLTPKEAIDNGADKIILGSAIFYEGDPRFNLDIVMKNLDK